MYMYVKVNGHWVCVWSIHAYYYITTIQWLLLNLHTQNNWALNRRCLSTHVQLVSEGIVCVWVWSEFCREGSRCGIVKPPYWWLQSSAGLPLVVLYCGLTSIREWLDHWVQIIRLLPPP